MALVKMTLQAYSDAKFSASAGSPYTVFLNPESFTHNSENSYDTPHPPGSPGDTPRFNYASQGKLAFSLLLDGTRVIDGNTITVSDEIATLRKLIFLYHGEKHSPYYVQVNWGSFQFQGRATTFNVSYTLFQPSGAPVRAKVELAFVSFIDAEALAQQADNQSADLTHRHLVQAGDTLPLLCHRIYGSSKYYLQVAARNNLVHFNRLEPGTWLHFPPLRTGATLN
jgi:hypothetical protein